MAVRVRVELHNQGFNDLRTSPGVMADLNSRAAAIAASAGPGNEVIGAHRTGGRPRGRATVSTRSYQAKRNEMTSKTLTRAIGAGRR
jgi:hypothetical protein